MFLASGLRGRRDFQLLCADLDATGDIPWNGFVCTSCTLNSLIFAVYARKRKARKALPDFMTTSWDKQARELARQGAVEVEKGKRLLCMLLL
jgi:hypothetical protein